MRRRTPSRDSVTGRQQTKSKPPVKYAPPTRSHGSIPVSPSTLTVEASSDTHTPPTGPSSRSGHLNEDQDPDQNREYYSAHGRFAGDVAAAIDMRAGLAPVATSNLVPFVDAPLFGDIDLHHPRGVLTDLPPRVHADRLVGIYWQHIHHVEPVLNRELFFHDYEASYSRPGALLHADHDVWPSILNAVFALAVQRQEAIPRQKRDEEGNRYFQRAWALLRPETIIWKPGSLELIQCLMLMNRYLHCTNNQQKTWMTAGLAMRIAQGMCCHLPEVPSTKDSINNRQSKQQVWASCVALDRCVSWSLSRTSAPPLILLPHRADSMTSRESYQQSGSQADHFTLGLELHEIGNQIQLAQTQTRNCLASRLGLPRLYQQDEYHVVAVQLDSCLNKLENNLPSDWKLQNLPNVVDSTSRAERYLLHLRPMLARFYLLKSHPTQAATPNPPNLSDRLLRECAQICIETAQKIASLIAETLAPDEPIGLLPWWYRIYYLHIAGINFLAAMFEPDLFTESISRSWEIVVSALRAHEHLSTYVLQCVRTFETLSTRILWTRYSNSNSSVNEAPGEGTSGLLYDDIFQDLGFDFDGFLFGAEDVFEGYSYVDNYSSTAANIHS
ncbi:hypothetical protein UA08_07261 [Talaromyces atroroseus]|uniref:Xylanolytic transcriptional activator regulatory domain-containing protein n=1 Tax=Talaromyces atroroseus TaxID=1441469 RepID=A0A225AAC6_TALAT|nr:hypothetical protein UA08_07261 [Talaromyces atroroseus]OKL57802.1 hypothetical protein UA08_07261 [Talaromyces atroroseus]